MSVLFCSFTSALDFGKVKATTSLAGLGILGLVDLLGADRALVSSGLGLFTGKGLGSYMAAKAGVVQLTRAMALEWAENGIRVNAIAPGYFPTEMSGNYFETAKGKEMIARIPQKRVGDPAELCGPLLLLASDASSYMTGSVITVDGGHLCQPL